MAVEALAQISIVWHNPSVVDSLSIVPHRSATILRTPALVCGIVLLRINECLLDEVLGKALGAFPILHTRASWIGSSTGTMDHVVDNYLLKICSCLLFSFIVCIIWTWGKLSCDNSIHKVRSDQPIVVSKDVEGVEVWQTSFLKLNSGDVGHHFTQKLAIDDVIHHLVLLQLEDSGHQVRPILGFLTREEFICNFLPVWIGCHSDKQIWLAIFSTNCHSILEFGQIPPWTA